MTVSAKKTFVNDLEDVIGEYLTGSNTKRVIKDVETELEGYNVEEIIADYQPEKDDLIMVFLNAKGTEGRSAKTIDRYRRELYKLCKSVGKPAAKITTDDVREYLASEQKRGLGGHTLDGDRQVFSSFFNWIWREGYIPRSPTGNIGAIKYKKEIKTPYSTLELEERSGVPNVHPHRFRRTLATMLIDRGMSIQDVAKILGHSNINTTLGYVYSDKMNVKHSYHHCIG